MNLSCNQFGANNISNALNANVYGNGTQSMVLAHGFGTDQTVWHYLVPYLACYFKVVVFDLVFAGNVDPNLYNETRYANSFDAYAEDLVCLLDELNVTDSIYVGHSMSAMIGGVASTMRPQLFNQLVLLCGSPRYLDDNGYIGGFSMSQLNETFTAMDDNYSSWVENFAPVAVGVNSSTVIAEFEHSLRRMDPNIASSVLKTVFLSDFRQVLPHILVPSLIIQSREDAVVPNSVALYMQENMGGLARVQILDTKGHFPHLAAYPKLLGALFQVLLYP